MKTNVVKVWTDDEAIYILTDKDAVFAERFINYPRLAAAPADERSHYECDNIGIRWEGLDEDLSYRGFMRKEKRIQ